MPEAKSSGTGLRKRVGPLSMGGWAASLGGALVLYILIKRYEASRSAGAAGGGTGAGILTAGGTIPGSGSSTTASGAPFSSYGAWLQAAIAQMTSGGGVDAGQALDGITSWLGGQCVNQSIYQSISGIISSNSIGLPPGWGTSLPPLTVCPSTASNPPPPATGTGITAAEFDAWLKTAEGAAWLQTPAGIAFGKSLFPAVAAPTPQPHTNENASLSADLIHQMTTNGESIISSVYDPTDNTMVYLTNKGGIYTVGSGFFGSVFSLGHNFVGTPTQVGLNSQGGYTIYNNQGQSYNFAKAGTGSDYAGSTTGIGV